MAISALQTRNTTADSYREDIRTFSGPPLERLLQLGLSSYLAAWTNPDIAPGDFVDDNGTIYTWTELTAYVSYQSALDYHLEGSSAVWNLTLQGTAYDEAYMGVGQTIVQWHKIATPTDQSQGWQKYLVGVIQIADNQNNFERNREWTREVRSLNAVLDRINAPRMSIGPIQIAQGGNVNALDTLATWSAEINRGEFTGTVPDVSPSNVVDGKLNSVWISETVPAYNEHDPAWRGLTIAICEVFIKPVTGWPNTAWWILVYNKDSHDQTYYLKDQNGNVLQHPYTGWMDIPKRSFQVICGNRLVFEQYFGSSDITIIDASEFNRNFQPNLTDGYVETQSMGLAWAPGGAARTYGKWTGTTVDSTACPEGYSISRIDWDTWSLDPVAGEWMFKRFPSGAGKRTNNTGVPIRVEFPENLHHNTSDIPVGANIIPLDNYVGFFATGGQGVVNSYKFNYTGKTYNGLTGVTWIAPVPTAPIAQGSIVYPFAENMAQTGYPITATHLARVRHPYVMNYNLFWSHHPMNATWDNTHIGWESTYYPYGNNPRSKNVGLNKNATTTDSLLGSGQSYMWVRTIMYVINTMETPVCNILEPNVNSKIKVPNPKQWPVSGSGAMWDTIDNNLDLFNYTGVSTNADGTGYLTGVTAGDGFRGTYATGTQCFSTGGDRAKVNEIYADLYHGALNFTGVPEFDGGETYDFIKYLWTSYLGYQAADFINGATVGAHKCGNHALAVAPISQVFDDLAKATTCIVDYGLLGTMTLVDDYRVCNWDPAAHTDEYTFTASSIRGTVSMNHNRSEISYVILNAQVPQSNGLPKPVRKVYPIPPNGIEPPTKARTEEVNDIFLPSEGWGLTIAANRYLKLRNNMQLSWTVKGVGEWVRPGMMVALTWPLFNWNDVTTSLVVSSVTRKFDRETMIPVTEIQAENRY